MNKKEVLSSFAAMVLLAVLPLSASAATLPNCCPTDVSKEILHKYYEGVIANYCSEYQAECINERNARIDEITDAQYTNLKKSMEACQNAYNSAVEALKESLATCSEKDYSYYSQYYYDRQTDSFRWPTDSQPPEDCIKSRQDPFVNSGVPELQKYSSDYMVAYCQNYIDDERRTYEQCFANNPAETCRKECAGKENEWECLSSCYDLEPENYYETCMAGHTNDYCWQNPLWYQTTEMWESCSSYYGFKAWPIDTPERVSKEESYYYLYELYNLGAFTFGGESEGVTMACPAGFVYNKETKVCDPEVTGKETVALSVSSSNFETSEDSFIDGKIAYSCAGECQGHVAGIQVSTDGIRGVAFEIVYEGEKYLTSKNPSVVFKIMFDSAELLASRATKIIVKEPGANEITIPVTSAKAQLSVEVYDDFVDQGEITTVYISVSDVPETEYTYELHSFMDATFYYGGETYPVSAFFKESSSKIEVQWKTPTISRKLKLDNFYFDEAGQWAVETGSTAARALTFGLGSKYLAFRGVSETAAGNLMKGEDTALALAQDGLFPAALAAAGDAGSIADIGLKTFGAYSRANDRFNAFNSNKVHIYDIPITVSVFLPSQGSVSKTIKVKVRAPEVIVE